MPRDEDPLDTSTIAYRPSMSGDCERLQTQIARGYELVAILDAVADEERYEALRRECSSWDEENARLLETLFSGPILTEYRPRVEGFVGSTLLADLVRDESRHTKDRTVRLEAILARFGP